MESTLFTFGKKPVSDLRRAINWTVLWIWLDPLLDRVLDYLNHNILTKLDGKAIKQIFDELDIFWLRNSPNKSYSESDIRLIVSMLVKFMVDDRLTRKELVALVDFIQRKWAPDIALSKEFSMTDEVIEARVEATVDQAIELYEKTYMEKPLTPEEFVASTATIIHHAPDGSEAQALLGGMIEIKSKIVY